MCVIFMVEKKRPSEQMIEKAWDRNSHGGGVAWREGEGDNRVVCWKKGIEDVDEMKELCSKLPTPFVAHFRVASCGGVKKQLTHPFPVTNLAQVSLAGKTKGYVLFHNGDWKDWDRECRQAAIMARVPLPVGKWSDTRALAWLSSIYGPGFMEFVPHQKGVIFGPKDYDIFTGSGWDKVEDIWCSNDYFVNKYNVHSSWSICRFGACRRKDTDAHGYCAEHRGGVAQAIVKRQESKTAETGGSQQTTPFPRLNPGQIISVEVAELMHKREDKHGNKLISAKKLKKIRKLHGLMQSVEPKKVAAARLKLENLTRKIRLIGQDS